jgi:hypothetical protein
VRLIPSAPRSLLRLILGTVRPLVASLLLASSGLPVAAPLAASESSRVDSVAAVIERAFQRGDADALGPILPRRLKVLVASRRLGISEGYYGADQLRVLLHRLFEHRATQHFAFLQPPSADTAEPITLDARWVYREEGAPAADIGLAFTLAVQDGETSLREIRDLR